MHRSAIIFDRESKLFLLIWDIVIMMSCFSVAAYLRFGSLDKELIFQGPFYLMALVYITAMYIFGCYDLDKEITVRRLLLIFFVSTVSFFLVVISLVYLLALNPGGLLGRGVLLGALSVFVFLAFSTRVVMLYFLRSLRAKAKWLFLVSEEYLVPLRSDIREWGLHGQVVVLIEGQKGVQRSEDGIVFGSIGDLSGYLSKKWTSVIIALRQGDFNPMLSSEIVRYKLSGKAVTDLVSLYEKYWRKLPNYYLEPSWFLKYHGFSLIRAAPLARLKRLVDIILASVLMVVCAPLLVLFAALISLESPGSPIYRQIRTGQGGKDFWIYKLRSMAKNAEVNGAQWAQVNDARVTRIGRFIRKSRIDELPQLLNVLRGEMSFIGPRPERPEFNRQLEEVLPYYSLRHLVRPGITGWAQVRYPYGASIKDANEKLQHELFYIKNFSFIFDVKIILRTISVVLFGSGR